MFCLMLNFVEGEVAEDGYNHTFILTGQSEHLTMKTAQPPGSPTNVGILSTTTHSIQIAWDPPHESGIEIVGEYLMFGTV